MKNHSSLLRRLVLMLAALSLAVTAALPAAATSQTTNQKVTDDTSGVVQIKVVYTDDNQNVHDIIGGTGFLINNNTVITCDHVVTIDDELLQQAADTFGKTIGEVKDRLGIQISVLRDVTINARVLNQSAEMDYAILNLESQLYNRTCLTLRHSDSVQQTETVYALGFPGEVEYFQDVNTYTSDDVTITNGQVNKLNRIGGVDYIQSSARITDGNSGGPLVDADGNVVGICQGATGSDFDVNYFYAIAIDQLIGSLDALGIDYDIVGGGPAPTAEPVPTEEPGPTPPPIEADKSELSAAITEAQTVEVKDYDETSGAAFTEALDNAQNVLANANATQEQVNDAVTRLSNAQMGLVAKGGGFPSWAFVLIGIVVVIIVVVLVIILTSKKKKDVPAPAPIPAPVPAPAPAPVGAPHGVSVGGFSPAPNVPQNNFTPPVSGMGAGATTVLNAGSDETTVLNAGSGETTVLNAGSASFGTLTRVKNGERISINNASFVIGKEMARVNYCISDNTSVSRTHVRLTSRGGTTYITDLGTTNGTFVNGVKLNPNQETALKSGDKLSLADEEFTFNAN